MIWHAFYTSLISFAQKLLYRGSDLGRRFHNSGSRCLQGRNLVSRRALPSRDNGPSVPHAAARGRSASSNERHHRLWDGSGQVEFAQIVSSLFLGRPANFANQYDTLCLRIGQEYLETVNERSPVEWVPANPHAKGLTQANSGCLGDGLVRQSPGAGNNS